MTRKENGYLLFRPCPIEQLYPFFLSNHTPYEEIKNWVQPDFVVICDKKKIVDVYNASDVYLLEETSFKRGGVYVKGDTLPESIEDFRIDLNTVFRE